MHHITTTIVVIDDDKMVRDAPCQTLNYSGFNCIGASDGIQAEHLLGVVEADVVITDIDMPRQDGFETIKNIRSRWPNVRIIAFSGSLHSHNYADRSTACGAEAYLTKPVSVSQLLCAVYACLSRSPTAAAAI